MILPRWFDALAARSRPVSLASADDGPTAQDCPQQTAPVQPEHVGADEEFGAELHAMREGLGDDLAHGVTALDPEQAAREREEAAWEEAFARAEGAIDMQAGRVRRRVDDLLDRMAPGWRDAICERRGCTLCVHDFDEAMELAGVIALPAKPVDYSTAEYRLVAL